MAEEAGASSAGPDADGYGEQLVVTASRQETAPHDLPYALTVVDLESIRSRKMSRTTPEILHEISSVLVQKTAQGQGSPFIRGFTGFHTLFMIDGIRLNHSAYRSGPNQYASTVDPMSIRQLEVVKGPSSTLYGSEAVGGTVQALTLTPASRDEGFGWRPSLYYRYGSAGESHVGNFTLRGQFERVGVVLGVSYRDFGDVEAGRGTGLQPNTGYEERFGDVKLEYRMSPASKLVFAHQRARQNDVPRTHKTIFAKSFEGTTVGTERKRDLDQARDLTYVQYHTERMGGFVDRAKLSLSFQRHEEERDRLKAEGHGGDLQGFDVGTVGLWGQFDSSTPAGRLTYGFEFYHDDVDSFRVDFDDTGTITGVGIQGPVADDATYDLLGVYVQDEKPLGPRLILTGGLRYTYARVDADKVDVGGVQTSVSDSWGDVVGNLRLLYKFGEHWNGYLGLSQGLRAPNLSDLTKLDETSAVEVPSPDLESEQFNSFEVGAKKQSRRSSYQLAYWHTFIDDLIVQSPTGEFVDGTPVVRKDSVGDGFVHGVELEGLFKPHGHWALFGNFTWMVGEVDQLDEAAGFDIVRAPLSRVMPVTLNVGARFEVNRGWIEALATVVGEQDKLALRDETDTSRIPPGGTPGYTVYSLRGGITLRKTLHLTASLVNLADKNYRVHGSGQNEAGRSALLSINATF